MVKRRLQFKMNFYGKTVIVTGAASEIGKKTVRQFLCSDARVAAVDIDQDRLDNLIKENHDKIGQLLILSTDITNSSDVDKTVARIANWSGRIDILVNMAGICQQSVITEITDKTTWDILTKNDLYGTFYFCRSVAKVMVKFKYGKIINFTSILGEKGLPSNRYNVAKKGIEGFSKSIALELAKHNINVNIINTPILNNKVLSERGAILLQSIPLGRFGEPEDVVKAVFFLSSEYSDYITGITLDVNGGMYIR